jgi:crotonobetaine/carnitine-CoA ligase
MNPIWHHDLRELTLPAVMSRQVERQPDKVFLTETASGRRITFQQMDRWSNRVANGLGSLGLKKGCHIGILMGNSAEHVALFFGLGKLGAVSVPINTAARGELLRYYLSQSDAEAVVVDSVLLPRLEEVLVDLPNIRTVVVVSNERQLPEHERADTSPIVVDFHSIVRDASDRSPAVTVKCSDLLMLAYTSGTTGPSKGSMLTHAAAMTYGTGAARAQGYRETDIFYVCLPLFHNNALLAAMGAALVVGGAVILSQRFSVSKFWPEIIESKATITNLLGAMTSFLWKETASVEYAPNSLRLVSMAPPPKFAREFEERFGLRVMSNYGLSDFGMATSYTADDPREKIGSIGRPRAGMEVKIVDDNDFEVPAGVAGEIVLRCNDPWRAALGYYKMPEATLAANKNQWFHTGDRGIFDKDGYLWFIDRKKDCIRRRGENISAFEVEQIIANHPEVAGAAVFPVATQANDEEVAAIIVRRPHSRCSEVELVEHCQRNMAYFMIPRYIAFRDELPVTVNQKVEKFKLRQDLEADLSKAWDRERAGIVLAR